MSDASAPSSSGRVGAYRFAFSPPLLTSFSYSSQSPCSSRFMFLMSLVMMTQWAIFSLPSSFFPAAARSIAISDSQIGIIFGAFPFGTMLGAAVATPLALRSGATRLVT
jgi:hypothetical protein